jgi:hypothetical protein
MRIIELIIDEDNYPEDGVELISMVKDPAIESFWVAMNKTQTLKFAQVDTERRIVMGAAMIPDMPIVREDDEGQYHVYFTKDTIRKAMELFFKKGYQNKTNYEHAETMNGMTVVESWIIEDTEKDKSALYGLENPVGTWMVSMKVENQHVWDEFVKTGDLRGFSIEGQFRDGKAQHSKFLSELEDVLSKYSTPKHS